ncbi:MAG: esterase/lipase family protein [Planctomycetota bacterium]|jgi:pimeloyl-ACP methyl ester carboxylesterase
MIRHPFLPSFLLVLAALSGADLLAQPPESQPEKPAEKPLGHKVIEVPVENGRVSLLTLSRRLFDAYGLDGDKLRFRDVRVRVTGMRGALTLGALRLALQDSAKVYGIEDGRKLRVEIDRKGARKLRDRIKRRILRWLSRVTKKDLLARTFELQEPERLPPGEPMVLLIHGLDSGPQSMVALREYLDEAGFHTGVFVYANDEAIDITGKALSKKLHDFKKRHGDRPIYLVTHSMGGLVSRYMLEMPGLDPGNVNMLVMLGTPNHGSQVAAARFLTDFGRFLKRGATKEAAASVLKDGLGEAGWDLRPDSLLLTELNARKRNPRVQYRSILGTGAPMSDREFADFKESLLELSETTSWTSTTTPWLKKKLQDMDELVNGKGDGAVALKRGRLDGVQEVTVDLGHRGLTQADGIPKAELGAKHPVFPKVVRWLREQRKQDRKQDRKNK